MLNVIDKGAYTIFELNRPPVNVLNMELLVNLREALKGVKRGLLIRGAGKCFSAGADVGEHLPGQVETMLPFFTDTMLEIGKLEIPTVSYIHGATLGGGFELALACDFVIAAEDVKLGVPEIQLGVFPPVAAATLDCGSRRALELILTGASIGAKQALDWGLVNRIGTAADAEQFLEKILRWPSCAIAAAKKAYRSRSAKEAERIYLQELMQHPEPVQGLKKFLEKT